MNNNTTEKKWVSLPKFHIPIQYDNAGDCLRALVQEKIGEEVKNGWSGVACRAQRLEEELDVLCQGFPENILIIKDYVAAARKAGHTVDAKIDSACASQVLNTLGVTNASPISDGLRYEDFANPKFAKEWLPTIGIRTTEEGRTFIINYLADKYGREHVAVVGCDERKIVMSGEKIADAVPVKDGEDGILITDCPMEAILKSNLCLYTIDAVAVHPIERECLRETNGRLVYHEQLSEMLQLMSGLPYAWASWTQKCLATKNADSCATLKDEFIRAALANGDFRRDLWRDEAVARSYIETKWKSWYEYGNRLISYAHIVSGDRYTRTVTHREVVGEVNFQDIENALMKGERVVLLLRHAERPPLEKDDPTFGKGIGITAKGRLNAKVFGYALGEFTLGWGERIVTSSMMTRCRNTAREILCEMIPWEEPGFGLSAILGDESPYFGRVSERMALANKGNYRESLNEYFRTGHQQGFQNLAEATDKLEEYIWNDYSRLNPALQVMVTHDINVGCFLAGQKVITQFNDSTWPRYLDSAVCFLDRYGRARYGFMRYYENKYTFDLK